MAEEQKTGLFGLKIRPVQTQEELDALLDPKHSLYGFNYKGMLFEPKNCIWKENKKLFYYDWHEERLKKSGLERAPTPQEISSLVIDCLEGKLSPDLDDIGKDILNSYPEFTCHAMQTDGNYLHIYEFVTGLKWNRNSYDVPKSKWCQNKKSFDIKGLKIGKSNYLEDINIKNPDLVEYLYTRKFEQLPKEMKEGNKKARIYITENEGVWPITHGEFWFDCFNIAASRGVRKKTGLANRAEK